MIALQVGRPRWARWCDGLRWRLGQLLRYRVRCSYVPCLVAAVAGRSHADEGTHDFRAGDDMRC